MGQGWQCKKITASFGNVEENYFASLASFCELRESREPREPSNHESPQTLPSRMGIKKNVNKKYKKRYAAKVLERNSLISIT